MNSKLLLALFLGASVSAVAQNNNALNFRSVGQSKTSNFISKPGTVAPTSGSRADIWSNDFSDASTWTLTNASGTNDAWVIGTAGPAGSFAIDPIESTTAANGFALFDSDLSCSGNQIVNLTANDVIDCSAFPAVVLQFEQQYRRFNDSTFVFASNDAGATWTKYAVNAGYTTNDATANPEVTKVNITPTAGGQSQVMIRFQFWSPSSYSGPGNGGPGCAYSWMVDDVLVTTPPDYDLISTRVFHASPVTDFEYGTYPLSQVDTVTMFAIVTNEGALSQNATVNYTVTRNGVEVNSGSSASFDIAPYVIDTIEVNTGYIPDQIGDYVLSIEITSANEDFEPTNNTAASAFSVTDFIYSGMNGLTGADVGVYTYSGATPGPYDPSKLGHIYQIFNDVTCKAIDIAVSSNSTVDTDLIIELFDAGDLATPLTIGDYRITSSHPTSATWITVVLPDAQNLVAGGFYLASMGSEADDKRFLFYGLPEDEDVATRVNVPDDNGVLTWFITDLTPAVNLNLDPAVGFADINGSDKLSVYPNPANQNISVKFELNGASNVTVNLVDMNGRVVFNKSISGKIAKYQDTISLADFANGIYTLQVTTANGISTEKVVIAH